MKPKIGDKFTKLTVIGYNSFSRKDPRRSRGIKCLCECGQIRDLAPWKLLKGDTKSCGCLKEQKYARANLLNILRKRKKSLTFKIKKEKVVKIKRVRKTIEQVRVANIRYTKDWQERNKDKLRKYRKKRHKQRMKEDVIYRWVAQSRRRLQDFTYRNRWKKSGSYSLSIGCTGLELRSHLESQFVDDMDWDNYGVDGWHIDHIIPLSFATDNESMLILNHYTNLQPLWSKDNIKKGNNMTKQSVLFLLLIHALCARRGLLGPW